MDPTPVTTTGADNADLAEIRANIGVYRGGERDSTDHDRRHAFGWAAADVTVLVAKVEALRAVLGPLLAEPIIDDDDGGMCRVCLGRVWADGSCRHEPGCPTRRADALMGRA